LFFLYIVDETNKVFLDAELFVFNNKFNWSKGYYFNKSVIFALVK